MDPARRQFVRKQGDIAMQLKELLRRKRWSQTELAERADLSPSQISDIVSGGANSTLATLTKLEAVLGADLIVAPMFYADDATPTASSLDEVMVDELIEQVATGLHAAPVRIGRGDRLRGSAESTPGITNLNDDYAYA